MIQELSMYHINERDTWRTLASSQTTLQCDFVNAPPPFGKKFLFCMSLFQFLLQDSLQPFTYWLRAGDDLSGLLERKPKRIHYFPFVS